MPSGQHGKGPVRLALKVGALLDVIRGMATTPAPRTLSELAALAPPGYPVTADGWVTYQRVRLPGTRTVLLVQKRDGCTRTVRAR